MQWLNNVMRRVRAVKPTAAGDTDLSAAVTAFNAVHTALELLKAHGVEMQRVGREWHSVNGCPLPGCGSKHDGFRVHADRTPHDADGPQWCCRRCDRGGDVLQLAVWLDGHNPKERAVKGRYLRERGYLDPTLPTRQCKPDAGFPVGRPPNEPTQHATLPHDCNAPPDAASDT